MRRRGDTPEEDLALGFHTTGVITKVEGHEFGTGWSVTCDHGYTCSVPRIEGKPEPAVGDEFTSFAPVGLRFHGQSLNGVVLWYDDIAQEAAKRAEELRLIERDQAVRFEKARALLDEQYESLDPHLRRRIDRFREAGGERWRVEYERYEMSCCVDAQKVAAYALCAPDPEAVVATLKNLTDEAICGLGIDLSDGHSGNSFDFVFVLARLLVTDPDAAVDAHGALANLVGCEAYSCEHAKAGE